MMNAWTKLRSALRNFCVARGGNVAITFAFATIPVIGAVGAGFDYSHANSVKADLQAALDSTALMVAKNAATLSNSDLQTEARNYFTALFNRPEATIDGISATYTASAGSQVVVNGSVDVPTTFLRVLGTSSMQTITVTGSSTTKWGTSRLRVALVLDNTGSMADNGKMTALKSATQSLLTQLKNAATTNGDVYVSIVPFVKDVNLGSANYNSNWIDWTDWDANNQTCSGNNGNGWGWGWGNGNGNNCTPNNHNTWNGCVVDRGDENKPDTANYDTNVVAPTTSITATLYSAEQYSSCPQAAMGLSYDWTSMSSLVNNMQPAGNTNQAIGLQVGWMTLAGGPFSVPAMDPNYTYQQVIILLTDGLNTQDRWYTSQGSIDARQQITCNNIKAAGITLYTIQVDTSGDPTSTLLQNCASTSDKFFLLTSASGIADVFNTIGTNLTKLRVAK